MNEYGRNEMKFELCDGKMFINFIRSSIPFFTLYTRDQTSSLRRNTLLFRKLIFFSNLIIKILHSLKFFSKLSSYLYYIHSFLVISFHLPNQTQHKDTKLAEKLYLEKSSAQDFTSCASCDSHHKVWLRILI